MEKTIYSILIADDDPDEIELLKILFEKHPSFDVIGCVQNGEEILSFIRNEDIKPDLILTDMYMPKMTAIEAIDIILTEENLLDMHIIVISTTINVINEAKFKAVKKIDFLTKAVTYYEYKALPEKVLSLMSGKSIADTEYNL